MPVLFRHRETPANQRDRSLCSHGGGESETEPRKDQGCQWGSGQETGREGRDREARPQEMVWNDRGGGGGPRRECLEHLGFKGDPRLRAGPSDLGRWRGPQTSASATSGLNRWLGWVGRGPPNLLQDLCTDGEIWAAKQTSGTSHWSPDRMNPASLLFFLAWPA